MIGFEWCSHVWPLSDLSGINEIESDTNILCKMSDTKCYAISKNTSNAVTEISFDQSMGDVLYRRVHIATRLHMIHTYSHAILDTLQWYCPRFLESMSKILANIAMDFSRFLRSRTLSPGTFTDQNIGSGSLGTHPDTEKTHGVQHLFFGVASNVSAITKDLGLTISEAEGSTCVIPKHLRLVLDTGQKGFFPHLLFH